MVQSPNRLLVGCLIGFVVFLVLSSCLVPVGMLAGGFTMFFSEDLITSSLGQLMCPANTIPEIISYDSVRMDEDGFERPSTTLEMVCKTPDGNTVTNLGGSYALIWNGIFILVGLILSLILAILVTDLIQRLMKKKSDQNPSMPPLIKIK